jgi:hypothetical protein
VSEGTSCSPTTSSPAGLSGSPSDAPIRRLEGHFPGRRTRRHLCPHVDDAAECRRNPRRTAEGVRGKPDLTKFDVNACDDTRGRCEAIDWHTRQAVWCTCARLPREWSTDPILEPCERTESRRWDRRSSPDSPSAVTVTVGSPSDRGDRSARGFGVAQWMEVLPGKAFHRGPACQIPGGRLLIPAPGPARPRNGFPPVGRGRPGPRRHADPDTIWPPANGRAVRQ